MAKESFVCVMRRSPLKTQAKQLKPIQVPLGPITDFVVVVAGTNGSQDSCANDVLQTVKPIPKAPRVR